MSFENFKKLNKEFKRAMRPFQNPTQPYPINAIIDGYNISNQFHTELLGLIYSSTITQEEEIQVFSVLKPRIQSRCFFFTRIFEIHTRLIDSCTLTKQRIVDEEIIKSLQFKDKNLKDFVYVEFLDQAKLITNFTRYGLSNYYHLPSQQTSKLTLKDEQLARQMSIAMEINYLTLLSHLFSSEKKMTTTLEWNRTKSDLVELIYGLHLSNAFKNTPSILEIATILCQAFNIVVDVYSTFKDIKSRTKDNSKFMNELAYILNTKVKNDLK